MATRTREVDRTALPLERTIRQPDPAVSDYADAALEFIAARRTRVVLGLTAAMLAVYFGFILLIAFAKPLLGARRRPGLTVGILLGVLVIVAAWVLTWIYVRWANSHYDRRSHELRRWTMVIADRPGRAQLGRHRRSSSSSSAITLAITCWAARRTQTTEQFYAAGHSITGFQNGLALAGDYMSAASFLGIAGLVALSGFDGLIYSIGLLVGWPVVMFLIAEPLRNLGKYTFADVVAYRLRQTPVRIAAAIGTLAVVSFYLIAQMVGAGNLINAAVRAVVRDGDRGRRRRDARATSCSAG